MKSPQNLIAEVRERTLAWDPADYLKDPEDVVAYLEAALEDGDSGVIMAALGDIARSKGIAAAAAKAGLGMESL